MNSAAKDVDTAPRIIYKPMPAAGADGQTIMKLVPAQTVKENFVLSQRSKPKSDLAPKTAETLNFTNPAPAQVDPCVTQFVRTQVSLGNVLPDKRNMDNKPPPPKQPQLKKVSQTETPAAHCETSETLPDHHSVTEKLSQIQRVPVSCLPPSNDRHVFTPSANSSPGSCVSPISPVNVDALPETSAPPFFKLLLNKTPPSGPKPSLKLIPQTPQRPNSPIRWIVEEENNSAPPALPSSGVASQSLRTPALPSSGVASQSLRTPALPSSGVASQILRTLAELERGHKQTEVINKSASLLSQDNTEQKEKDAFVLFDGKMFRKHHPTVQLQKKDFSTPVTKSYIFTKTTSPSDSAQRRDAFKLIIQRGSHEVRDFCEDARDEKSKQGASSATSPDDDNVIFMLHTPPTLKEDLTPETQTAAVKGTVQMQEESAVTKLPAGPRRCCKKHPSMSHSTQQAAESMEHGVETIASDSDSTSSAADLDCWTRESFGKPAQSSPLKPASSHISDHLLRRMFGITTDIKICLQRIDEPMSKVHHEELFLSGLHSPPESDSNSGSISVRSEEELSADSASHTHSTRLKCSHSEAETKPKNCSGQSDTETDSLFGYMEPIDEDFISMDEKHEQDVTAGTREDKRRIGRTRKRTTCPCCVSGAQNEVLRLSLKTDFPGKKGGAKTARKRVRTPGKIRCPTAKRKSSDSLPCSSSEELRCHEEIRRLRELLREKEEALELLRRNSS